MYALPSKYQLCESEGSAKYVRKCDDASGAVGPTRLKASGQMIDCEFLVLERRSILVIDPAQLLEDFGVVGILLDDTLVRVFGSRQLNRECQRIVI